MVYRLIVVLFFGGMVGNYMQAAQPGADGLFAQASSVSFISPLLGASASIIATQDGEGQDEAPSALVKLPVAEIDTDKKEREEEVGIDDFLENKAIQLLLKHIYCYIHCLFYNSVVVDQKEVNRFYLENKTKVLKSAFPMAVNTDNADAIEILCKNITVNVNMPLNSGSTYLMYAVCCGYKKVVERLLAEGAKVDVRDSGGEDALMHAAKNGYWEIVDLLRTNGARLENCSVEKLLEYAVTEKSEPSLIEELLTLNPSIDLNQLSIENKKFVNKVTLLIRAAVDNNIGAIQVLCGNDRVDFDRKNDHGSTALMFAALLGHRKAVEILLEKNARLDIHDVDGDNVVVYAAEGGQWDIVDLLRQKGAEVEQCSAQLLLAFAVRKWGDIAFIKEVLVLDSSLDLNKPLPERSRCGGCTFLMLAAEAGNKEAVKILLDAGVDVNIKNENNNEATALDYAIANNKMWGETNRRWGNDNTDSIMQLLRNAGAKTGAELSDPELIAVLQLPVPVVKPQPQPPVQTTSKREANLPQPQPQRQRLAQPVTVANPPTSFWSSQNYGAAGLVTLLTVAAVVYAWWNYCPSNTVK